MDSSDTSESPAETTVTVYPDAVATPATATPVNPAAALPVFEPADINLAPLDPRQNGVLEALGRIESAITTARRAALVKGHDGNGAPMVNAGASRTAPTDAAGRLTSTQALAGAGNDSSTAGLQQKIRRVKRIERRVERTLPDADRTAGSEDADTVRTVTVRPDAPPAAKRKAEQREAAQATAEATTQALREKRVPATSASDDKDQATARPLTADDLRKMKLRGDNGRFLSRDEKDGMTKAELSQARVREQRDQAKQDEKTTGVLGKLGNATREAMSGQGNATDAAGTAAGGSYFLAAKEVYGAVDELAGENSKAQRLYRWAQKKRDESSGERDQDSSDNARPVGAGGAPDADEAAKQREKTAQAVDSQATADAKQREESAQQKTASVEARESQHRADDKSAAFRHDDNQESIDSLTKANEDGFEDVVEAIKRYSGGDGGGMSMWPGGRRGGRRGGARGGRRGARRGGGRGAGRGGMFRRGWDKLRSAVRPTPSPSGTPSRTGKVVAAVSKAKNAVVNTAPARAVASAASKTTRAAGAVANKAGSAVATGAKLSGKALGAVAAPLTGYLAYKSTQAELAERDDLTKKQKTTVAGSSAAGAGGGALAGAGAGGAAGAAIGSLVPILGTAIGGGVGAIVGGALGAWGGEKAGRELGDAVADRMDDRLEEARKALRDRDDALKTPGKREVKWYNPSTWTDRGGAGVSPQAKVNQGKYTAGGDEALANEDGFGRVAEKYESSGMGVSTVSTGKNDKGGVSYGIHQLASDTGTMQTYLDSKEGEKYRDQFAGMSAGSNEFTAQYKQIAANDGDAFAASQQDFIKRTHYDPVASYAQAKGVNTDSEAIQEMLYSQSVQTSGDGNEKIIDDAMGRVGKDASDEEVIDAMYAARGDYVSPYVTHSAGRGRYAKERKDVQAIAARQGEPEAPAPEPVTATSTPGQPPKATRTRAAGTPNPPASIAAPVNPNVAGETVEPIDAAKAQKAMQPAAPPPQIAQAPAAKAAPASQAGNDGKDGKAGTQMRGGTSSPGVKEIQMGFDDTTLMLMSMDRI